MSEPAVEEFLLSLNGKPTEISGNDWIVKKVCLLGLRTLKPTLNQTGAPMLTPLLTLTLAMTLSLTLNSTLLVHLVLILSKAMHPTPCPALCSVMRMAQE